MRSFVFGSAVVAAVLSVSSFSSAAVLLDFEGLQNLEGVGGFYNGGTGSLGSSGANLGVTFSSNSLAIIDADAGGTGNFGDEPSPSTVLFFLSGAAATMTYASGFDTGFSFYYSAINQGGTVRVYDGLNATGNVLATLNLPTTPSNGGDPNGAFSPFVPIGVAFAGIAKSIDFGGAQNQIGFDNVTFGSATPVTVVPTPTAAAGGFVLAAGMIGRKLRRSRSHA